MWSNIYRLDFFTMGNDTTNRIERKHHECDYVYFYCLLIASFSYHLMLKRNKKRKTAAFSAVESTFSNRANSSDGRKQKKNSWTHVENANREFRTRSWDFARQDYSSRMAVGQGASKKANDFIQCDWGSTSNFFWLWFYFFEMFHNQFIWSFRAFHGLHSIQKQFDCMRGTVARKEKAKAPFTQVFFYIEL